MNMISKMKNEIEYDSTEFIIMSPPFVPFLKRLDIAFGLSIISN